MPGPVLLLLLLLLLLLDGWLPDVKLAFGPVAPIKTAAGGDTSVLQSRLTYCHRPADPTPCDFIPAEGHRP
ncbi:hypothetical protein SAMN04488567_2911 [Limimaricola pyoseonensis]|uniref:Uncharacterized protein n=1 Tax=Limimaricola pyoseonensis TaxID=521013 RepID=A0A1G7GSW8_9RHOB|nr:hypothetical protein SAMN04488567_2911 [Limimaricola pyoseonensis]